jgi:NitT/TauT family transport system substrate-binding protein
MPKISRLLIAGFSGLMLCVGLSPARSEPVSITVGLGFAVDHMPVFVAKEKGFFDKHNLNVTLKAIPLPSTIGPALVAGDIQIAAFAPVNVLQGRENGIDFVVVSGQSRNDKDNVTTSLVTAKGLKVAQASDLKGKKVGVPGLNSMSYVMLVKWLKNNKVPVEDVTFVEMAMPTMGDLLRNGKVDMVMVPDPFRSRIVTSGAGDYSIPVPIEVTPDSIAIFWVAMESWVKSHPEAARGFRAAVAEGMDFIKQHRDEAREIEKKYTNYNSPNWPAWNVNVSMDDIKFFYDAGREIGLLHKDLDLSKVVY